MSKARKLMEEQGQNPVYHDFMLSTIMASAHEVIRDNLGDRYYAETQPIRDCLNNTIEENSCSIVEAGLVIIEAMGKDDGFGRCDMLQTMAVTFELYTNAAHDQAPDDLGLVPVPMAQAPSGANNE